MGVLLSYSLFSGLVLLVLYLTYMIFLARENQHGYSRGVLLTIYLLSFISVPVMTIMEQWNVSDTAPISVTGNLLGITATGDSKSVMGTVLIWIFMTGMAITVMKTILTWLQILRIIHAGEKIKRDDCILVITENTRIAPFSWMRYVVISHDDYESNCSSILTHELKHVACHHWVDLLIAQLVCIVNWFNPVAWLMRDEVMLIHEYQADEAVMENGYDPQEYQMLLIKKAVDARFPSLANSLNHNKLKKRITMMYKKKSCGGRKFKALALVPTLALALCVVSLPSVRATVITISSSGMAVSKDNEKMPIGKAGDKIFEITNINNNGYQTTVDIKGEDLGNNLTVSGGIIKSDGKEYQAKSMQCYMTDGKANIKVDFPEIAKWDKASMTLNVNGEEITFHL